MFLNDELEYKKIKRKDDILGWAALSAVAGLVFMFGTLINSAPLQQITNHAQFQLKFPPAMNMQNLLQKPDNAQFGEGLVNFSANSNHKA